MYFAGMIQLLETHQRLVSKLVTRANKLINLLIHDLDFQLTCPRFLGQNVQLLIYKMCFVRLAVFANKLFTRIAFVGAFD